MQLSCGTFTRSAVCRTSGWASYEIGLFLSHNFLFIVRINFRLRGLVPLFMLDDALAG